MTELVVEVAVPVIPHAQDAVLNPKGIGEIHTHVVAGDLHRPAIQVAPVEERNPSFQIGIGVRWCAARRKRTEHRDKSGTST